VFPAPPIPVFGGKQFKLDLIYKFSGLECVALSFAFHEIVCKSPEIGEHEREKVIFSVAITISPPLQQIGDVARIRHTF